jgi:hypothetical protein
VGIAVLLAFIEATSYELVSSRTPFVIMVPLLLLIGFQWLRLWRSADRRGMGDRLAWALKGGSRTFHKVLGMCGLFAALMAGILVAGHVLATFLFIVGLTRGLARERWKVSLLVALGTVGLLYLLFEYGFNVTLYPGLVARYFMGYRDF